jgi:zinc protease
MAVMEAIYPPDHPYQWMTIGAAADIRAAKIDDVRAFFQTYYRPRNASLALAGDVDTAEAVDMVTRYFGDLDAGDEPPPVRVPAAAPQSSEQRVVLEDRVELPRVYLSWLSPAIFAQDDAELDLVAEVLAGGKTSRLYRKLVYEERIATEVAASQSSRELGGYFQIIATAAPGRTLPEVERVISRALDEFIEGGPTPDEMERCLAQAEANFVYRLQTVGGFGGKSDQLNAYNVFVGDPGFFGRDLDRYRRVTPSSMQHAARSWLRPQARVALSVVPKGRLALALSDSRPVTGS